MQTARHHGQASHSDGQLEKERERERERERKRKRKEGGEGKSKKEIKCIYFTLLFKATILIVYSY